MGLLRTPTPTICFSQARMAEDDRFTSRRRIHDRLIHLVGENGPGCCNVSHYKFDALAYLVPYPDYNLDGVVDAADYIMGARRPPNRA